MLTFSGEHFLIATTPQGVSLLARLDGVSRLGEFDRAMGQEMALDAPVPIREMEARLKGEHP